MDLTWNLALFYLFAGALVIAALGVISVKNSVHAALLLVFCFFTTAALWLLMQAEFLAIALVLVYVAIMAVRQSRIERELAELLAREQAAATAEQQSAEPGSSLA